MDEARQVIEALTQRGQTLATAESCTGGLLGAALTDVSGASAVYLGGIVSYAYEVKERFLGVDPKLLKRKGAVCAEVAEQMAQGARQELHADYALSITGNAGPGTDPFNPNVGEIFIACADAQGTRCKELCLQGDRGENRRTACQEALNLLLSMLIP